MKENFNRRPTDCQHGNKAPQYGDVYISPPAHREHRENGIQSFKI
jgi:hypothetical protein